MTESRSTVSRRHFLRGILKPEGRPSTRRSFARVRSIDDFAGGVLWGAGGRNPDDVFVVGDDGLVLHHDGRQWLRQPNDSDLPLHAVACTSATEAIAVGWLGIISRYENGLWRAVQGGKMNSAENQIDGDRSNYPLFGIWSDGAGDAWAVGDGGRIVYGSGEKWRELDSGCSANLRAIVGLPDGSLLVSGADGTTLRGSGGSWERLDSGSACMLTGLACLETGDVIAVGGEYTSIGSDFVGRILHFDGEKWREVFTERPLPRLRDIASEGGRFLAVGDSGYAIRYDGRTLEQCPSGTEHDLYGAVCFGEDSAWICGGFGSLLGDKTVASDALAIGPSATPNVGEWEDLEQKLSHVTLRGVWGDSQGEVFAVGDAGTVLHFDGSRWEQMKAPTNAGLLGVWGSSAQDVYVVGESGLVLCFDGDDWRVAYQGSLDLALVAVTGFADDQIYCVGDGGLVLRFDGIAWERAETGTSAALFAVWGLDAEHVLAVGEAGVVLRFNGQHWKDFSAGTDNAIYGVWGDALDRIFLSGLAGTLVRFDGQRWIKRPSRDRSDLLAVSGAREGPVLAVGSLGTALRHEEGEWFSEDTGCDDSLRSICVASDGTAFAVGDTGRVLRRRVSRVSQHS